MGRFSWKPGDVIMSQCVACAHKHSGKATCNAFPNGIPHKILTNEIDHRQPVVGDNDIQFEAKPGQEGDFRSMV